MPLDQPSLSPARARLAVEIEAVRVAAAAQVEAARPVATLRAVIDAATAAQRKLDDCRAERDAAIGDWLANGSIGSRPAPSIEEGAAQLAAADLRDDAGAAALAFPGAVARSQEADSVLMAAARRRDEAVALAAVEAAADVIRAEYLAAMERCLAVETRLRGLQQALFETSQRTASPILSAASASGRIAELIAEARGKPAVPRDDAGGRAFLAALADDPTEAQL